MSFGWVYDLAPSVDEGPWADGRHPGVVVEVGRGTDARATVVPMTSAEPRGVQRVYSLHLTERVAGLDGAMWIRCDCPTTVPLAPLMRQSRRAILPGGVMRRVMDRLAAHRGEDPF
jgi:uncharacterized protein YifN (PemK superfamily)